MPRSASNRQLKVKLLFLVIGWAILVRPSVALDPKQSITQLNHRSWGAADGLDAVYSVTQTTDGYLWVIAAGGLFRFDGIRWMRWEPLPGESTLPTRANMIFGDREGNLWCRYKGALIRMREGHVVSVIDLGKTADVFRSRICEDKQGGIWVSGNSEIFKVKGDQVEKFGPECGIPPGWVDSLTVDRNNALWISSRPSKDGTIFGPIGYIAPGEKQFRACGDIMPISSLAQSADGKFWAAQSSRSVRPFIPGEESIAFSHPEILVGSQSILIDRDGTLWIATLGDGVRRARYPTELGTDDIAQMSDIVDIYTDKDGLSSNFAITIFEDREGSVWIGSFNGVDCFRENKVTSISVRDGLPFESRLLTVLATPDGSIWIGAGNRFGQVKDGTETIVDLEFLGLTPPHPVGTAETQCLYNDPVEGLLLGTGFGIAKRQGDVASFLPMPGGLELKNIRAMTRDNKGGLWMSDPELGVFRLLGDTLETFPEIRSELGEVTSAAFTDHMGRVWLGSDDGRLACYEDGRFRWFSTKDGFFGGRVMSITTDTKGRLWFSGRSGISCYSDNRFLTLRQENGLPSSDIFGLIQDNSGDFWLFGRSSLLRITAQAMEEALGSSTHQLIGELFTENDGLRGFAAFSPYRDLGLQGHPLVTKRKDGTLWFATTAGLSTIDPQHTSHNALPPPIHIQRVVATGKEYETSGALEFPEGTRNCEIDYAALSFVQPAKVRYKYKLEGYDEKWVDAGGRREAFYSKLLPKEYKFQVIACNNDGVWNETGATLAFTILPAIYERAWFPLLYLVPAALVVWGLFRLRIKQVTDRLNLQLETQGNERKRIAQELHDTLLQGFTGIGLKLDAITNGLPDSLATVREQLRKILGQSDQYLTEARRSVWELRSKTLEQATDLSQALSNTSESLVEGTSIRLIFATEGNPRKLDPLVESNLLRICEEAVTNAVKHAQPTQIQVSIAFGTDEVRLRIADDGHGFDPEGPNANKAGHFGLMGMQERAKSLDGTLTVRPLPEKGTEVDVTVPLA
jgi:signal transduction histidine kinase/ligand-binding sensor domain-containing protein